MSSDKPNPKNTVVPEEERKDAESIDDKADTEEQTSSNGDKKNWWSKFSTFVKKKLPMIISVVFAALIALFILVMVLFGKVNQMCEGTNTGEKTEASSNCTRLDTTISFQELVEQFNQLREDFQEYRQAADERASVVAEKLAQLERQTNVSILELHLKVGNISIDILEQKINSLNETTSGHTKNIKELSSNFEHLDMRLRTVNGSVQVLQTDQLQLRTNLSELTSSFDQHQDNLTSQIADVQSSLSNIESGHSDLSDQLATANQKLDNQDDRISDVETAQSNFMRTQALNDDRIARLEDDVSMLKNSGGQPTQPNILLLLTSCIVIVCGLLLVHVDD